VEPSAAENSRRSAETRFCVRAFFDAESGVDESFRFFGGEGVGGGGEGAADGGGVVWRLLVALAPLVAVGF
jgi:hypothetical protein